MANPSLIAEVGDLFANGSVIHLLGLKVKLIATRIACGVEVADVLEVLLDGADDIAFHDLHVIDVEEELEAWGADTLAEFDTVGSMVASVVGVVDLAIQELHAESDACVFGTLDDASDKFLIVIEALLDALAPLVTT